MDIRTKKYMLYLFTAVHSCAALVIIYKAVFEKRENIGRIVNLIFVFASFFVIQLILNHDIKKFERWKREYTEFNKEDNATVTEISLSSTRENGINTVILTATYKGHDISFSGIHPDFQFKYKIGDDIKIRVHENDSQRFVLEDLK